MRLLTRQEVKTVKRKEEAVLLARLTKLHETIHKKEEELERLEAEHDILVKRIDTEIEYHLNRLRAVQQ